MIGAILTAALLTILVVSAMTKEEEASQQEEIVLENFSADPPKVSDDVLSPETPSEQQAIEKSLPPSAQVEVPFLVQAPFGEWDPLHEEACEEASLIMVEKYLKKVLSISKEEGDEEIKKLVAWQEQNGYGVSITLAELNRVAAGFYGLDTGKIIELENADQIKREIANGYPVIVPAAGKVLPNPNFQNGGPYYHMLVVKGYNETGFITNDPGTRKGEGFFYTYDELMNAIHDYDSTDMLKGAKRYLVFE